MQKIFFILAASCVFLGLSLCASAQDKTVDKTDMKQLEAIYKEFDAATKKLDIKPTEKYLDEKFEVEQDGRKFSRDEILAVMKMFFDSAIEISEVATKIEKSGVSRDGKYSLETSTLTKGKFKLADGKISNLEIYTKSADIWTKTQKGWKLISQISRGSKILADGKDVSK